jgi:CheY-like chemotaxis protein
MKNILIIEDNTELQALYTEALKARGFGVTSVTSAQQGMTLLQTTVPDLIILDIMLPGGENGFDLLEKMKKDPRLQHIPVFVVTNLDSEEKTAREIGVVDYIVKTNTPIEQIIEKISTYLSKN